MGRDGVVMLDNDLATTWFAPVERATPAELASQRACLTALPLVADLIDRLPDPVLVLNTRRQIVLANRRLADLLECSLDDLIGQRPGEALKCVHAHDCPGGCGTSLFCRVCGAVGAILDSQHRGALSVQECRISQALEGATTPLDVRVWATPLVLDGLDFTLFTVRDISDEKRRRVLERLFFHDVLNAVGGLQSIIELWPSLTGEDQREFSQMAHDLVRQIIEEIESQRDLSAAERGDLITHPQTVDVSELLTHICILYSHHALAQNKRIPPPWFEGPARITTDEVLLRRVVGNLLKNALEASLPGQTITVAYRNHGRPTIAIHNEGVMADEVQLQVFQRLLQHQGRDRPRRRQLQRQAAGREVPGGPGVVRVPAGCGHDLHRRAAPDRVNPCASQAERPGVHAGSFLARARLGPPATRTP